MATSKRKQKIKAENKRQMRQFILWTIIVAAVMCLFVYFMMYR